MQIIQSCPLSQFPGKMSLNIFNGGLQEVVGPHALPAHCHPLQSYQLGQDGDRERVVRSLRAQLQVQAQQPQQQAESEEQLLQQLHLHLRPSQVQPLGQQLPDPPAPPLHAAYSHLIVQLLSQQVNIIQQILSLNVICT